MNKDTINNLNNSGARKCLEWLKYCLSIGWKKEHLKGLQKIWLKCHDKNGNLLKSELWKI